MPKEQQCPTRNRAAQTNAEDAKAAEAPVTPAAVTEDVNDVQFEDNGAAEPQKQQAEPRKEQSKTERAMHAQKRREAEQRARELEEVKRQAKMEGLKEGLGGKNPIRRLRTILTSKLISP